MFRVLGVNNFAVHLHYCVFLHNEADKLDPNALYEEYKYAFTMAYFCLHINIKEINIKEAKAYLYSFY